MIDGGTNNMYYIHKDYLGSYESITDDNGVLLERHSFDPWGRRRNPSDWAFTGIPGSNFDRGYTGHQHMGGFELINMNGRVYDPWLGRFLSPDPFVQAPAYSQNHNRYSYALNNPLKYVDPSGYHYEEYTEGTNPMGKGAPGDGNGHNSPYDYSATSFSPYNFQLGNPYRMGYVKSEYSYNWGARQYEDSNGDYVHHSTVNGWVSRYASKSSHSLLLEYYAIITKWKGYGGDNSNLKKYFNGYSYSVSYGVDVSIINNYIDVSYFTDAEQVSRVGIMGQTIANVANGYVGSTDYNKMVLKDNFRPTDSKCNKFVYDVLVEAGANPGLPNPPGRIDNLLGITDNRPPTTSQWADPNFPIDGWVIVSSAMLGDVASFNGHVGIVYSNELTISATPFDGVVKNNWGFRTGQTPIFRRFTGN